MPSSPVRSGGRSTVQTPLMLPVSRSGTAPGEFADEGLLIGQRAIPPALERAGFQFHHNTIGEALDYATARRDHD